MYVMRVAPFLLSTLFSPLLAFINIFCRMKVDNKQTKNPVRTCVRVSILNDNLAHTRFMGVTYNLDSTKISSARNGFC